MSGYETIILERDGAVTRITLDRPDRLNSFTRAMHAELRDALRRHPAGAVALGQFAVQPGEARRGAPRRLQARQHAGEPGQVPAAVLYP